MLEFGFYWQHSHTFNDAARASARIGATLAREPAYQDDMIEALKNTVGSLPQGSVDKVTIYKADSVTGRPASGEDPDTCTIDCYRFTWNDTTKTFDPVVGGPSWPPLQQAACGSEDSTDYIGVWIHGWYRSLTGLVGDREVSESTVLRLEPVPLSVTCEPAP